MPCWQRYQALWLRQHTLLRFLVVGAGNTLFGYGLFAFFLWLGWHYSVAAALATVLGVLFNFKTTGALVFRSHDHSRIVYFVLVYAVIYVLNVAGLAFLGWQGLNAYWSGLVLVLPLALLSFGLNKRFVFKNHE